MLQWNQLLQAAKQYKRILITSHVRPDGDALGSELGVAELMTKLGCVCKIVNVSPTPSTMTFLDPRGTKIKSWTDKNSADWIAKHFDAVLIVDTSSKIQLDCAAEPILESGVPLIIIDHHAVGDSFNALRLQNSTADSTGLLITEAFVALKITPSAQTAQALFAAICTDTGWFRFSSVTQETFAMAAQLVQWGAKPFELYALLFEKYPFARLKMTGIFMDRAQQYCDNRVIISYAKKSDFKKFNAQSADLEGIINQLLTVASTQVAIILTEQTDTQGRKIVKINFRSKTSYNVAKLAQIFGGGGHIQASGASVRGKSIKQIIDLILVELEKSFRTGST